MPIGHLQLAVNIYARISQPTLLDPRIAHIVVVFLLRFLVLMLVEENVVNT